jgi:hypothetical protein
MGYDIISSKKGYANVWYFFKKNKKKLCSDPGSNRGNVEPSVGSLTLCPQCYKAIQKNPKKNSLIFYGQKHVTCSLWDSWLVATIWNSVSDWLKKKSGKNRGRAGNLRFSGSLYQKRTHVNYYNSCLKIEVYIENFRTRHSSVGNCFAISSSAALE